MKRRDLAVGGGQGVEVLEGYLAARYLSGFHTCISESMDRGLEGLKDDKKTVGIQICLISHFLLNWVLTFPCE